MRHPFWRWTGWLSWLSVGLAGCLHGQDWRAAVTKPLTRTVADRRESRPAPKVVGPFRKGSPMFAAPPVAVTPPNNVTSEPVSPSTPTATVVTPTAVVARPRATTSSSGESAYQSASQSADPPTTRDEAQPRGTSVVIAEFQPSPAPPSEIPTAPLPSVAIPPQEVSLVSVPQSPVLVEPPRTGPFAEFERTIPLRRTTAVVVPSVPHDDGIEVVVSEEPAPAKSIPLPVITPAGMPVPPKPLSAQNAQPLKSEPAAVTPDARPQPLFSKSVGLAKELPAVTDTTTTPAKDSPSADAEQAVRPRDVAVLVEQVFEDLRQRRLNDARQRTEWLKELVTKRASSSPVNSVREEPSAEATEKATTEPQRLKVDPKATATDKFSTESFFDDEETTSRK